MVDDSLRDGDGESSESDEETNDPNGGTSPIPRVQVGDRDRTRGHPPSEGPVPRTEGGVVRRGTERDVVRPVTHETADDSGDAATVPEPTVELGEEPPSLAPLVSTGAEASSRPVPFRTDEREREASGSADAVTGSLPPGDGRSLIRTGVTALDAAIEEGGVTPGTLTAVRGDARGPGDKLIHHFGTDRHLVYFSLLTPRADVVRQYEAIREGAGTIEVYDLASSADGVAAVREVLDERTFPQCTTFAVSPVDALFGASEDEYARLLHRLVAAARSARGLAVVHATETDHGPPTWMSTFAAATVVQVTRRSSGSGHEATVRTTDAAVSLADGDATFTVDPDTLQFEPRSSGLR
jgi:hypothetical protein